MTLDLAAARRAIRTVADELGLDDEALAEGMLAIVNAKMADAMRTITSGAASIPATIRSSPSVGPGRCTPSRWPRSWTSPR